MTKQEQESFRPVLVELQKSITAELDGTSAADSSITPDNAIGRLTRMEAIQAQSISQAGKARLKKRLGMIDRALRSIYEGTYGSCVSCGEDINAGRLEIRPESRLCVRCAGRR